MESSIRITTCEMHCGGEPLRIVESGFPVIPGQTLLEKRRYLIENLDHLRKFLMFEPRGHRDMYGCLVLPAIDPNADYSVLFMHNEGYSTMCGHATICLGRYIVEKLWKLEKDDGEETRVVIECPCGLVEMWVKHNAKDPDKNGSVRFLSVPAYVYKEDMRLLVPTVGNLTLSISYGGAYYAVVPADQCGIDFKHTPIWDVIKIAMVIKRHVVETTQIQHPSAPDLAFLYGIIFVDDSQFNDSKKTTNLTVFANGEVDRCPTGSGVTARMALLYKKGIVKVDEPITFISAVNGSTFIAKIASAEAQEDTIRVEVTGKGFYTGNCEFTLEHEDQFGYGFMVN